MRSSNSFSQYPVSTRLSLSGTIIVRRDIAHAKLKERMDKGEGLPQNIKHHPIDYAGPAKTLKAMPPVCWARLPQGVWTGDVDQLQSEGGSMIMLAKGNRSQQVTDACRKHGGFYLGSIGGPAAVRRKEPLRAWSVWNTLKWGWRTSGKLRWKPPGVYPGG
ncbi:fumarate hydratase C-terminal domain-containing protein [Shigella flexneri]